MGSGKSTVGQLLADEMKWMFVDLDYFIEKRTALPISEIFRRYGEVEFRTLETSALRKQSAQEKLVVACGGGAPCFGDNLNIMKNQGVVIYLKASPELIVERVQKDVNNIRPLLQNMSGATLRNYVHLHLRKREEYYEQADHIISVHNDLQTIVQEILITVDSNGLLHQF